MQRCNWLMHRLADLLQIIGQQQKIPVTGTIALNAHVSGTLKNLNGSGHLSLSKGIAYGEAYDSAVTDLTAHGEDIELTNVLLKLHGMQIAGNGGYDLASSHLHGHIDGQHLVLSKFDTVKRANIDADGILSIVADANGTLTAAGAEGKPTARRCDCPRPVCRSKPPPRFTLRAQTMYLTAQSTLTGAKVDATGQVQLTDDYKTQAKLTITGLDIGKPLAMFGSGTVKAQSSINGIVTVSGPLKNPEGTERHCGAEPCRP